MSRARVIAAAALFLALTVVKFVLPQRAEAFCGGLHSAMESGQELRAAMVTLGERLTSEEGELVAALGLRREEAGPTPRSEGGETAPSPSAAAYQPEGLPNLRAARKEKLARANAETPEPSPEPAEDAPAAPEDVSPAPEPVPSPAEPSPEPTPAAVERFLEEQSAYADYALPANVSYEMPALALRYVSPVSGASSSGFGYRLHPLSGEVKFHYGTDFAVWTGTEVRCFADGVVAFAGEEPGYGNYLIVDHEDGCCTLYAHCSELLVSAGERVAAGQTIALSGDSGRVTGPHLHFELQRCGTYLNPEYYVAAAG